MFIMHVLTIVWGLSERSLVPDNGGWGGVGAAGKLLGHSSSNVVLRYGLMSDFHFQFHLTPQAKNPILCLLTMGSSMRVHNAIQTIHNDVICICERQHTCRRAIANQNL